MLNLFFVLDLRKRPLAEPLDSPPIKRPNMALAQIYAAAQRNAMALQTAHMMSYWSFQQWALQQQRSTALMPTPMIPVSTPPQSPPSGEHLHRPVIRGRCFTISFLSGGR